MAYIYKTLYWCDFNFEQLIFKDDNNQLINSNQEPNWRDVWAPRMKETQMVHIFSLLYPQTIIYLIAFDPISMSSKLITWN